MAQHHAGAAAHFAAQSAPVHYSGRGGDGHYSQPTDEEWEGSTAYAFSVCASFVSFVMAFVGAFVMKGKFNWQKNEGALWFLAITPCLFSVCSMLLLFISECQIRYGRTPQEKVTEAACEAEKAAAALRKGVATEEVLAAIGWVTSEEIQRDHLVQAATHYARKKIAAERAADGLPTRDGCCDIFAEPPETQYRRCRLLTAAMTGLLTIVWATLLFRAMSEEGIRLEAGQNKRDLCSLYMGLYCGSFISTWALLAYDVDFVGALCFFSTWPDEDEVELEESLDPDCNTSAVPEAKPGVAPEAKTGVVSTTQRLNWLEELREKGLINDNEYREKKAEIMQANTTQRLNWLEELQEKGLINDNAYREKKAEIMQTN